MFYDRYIELCEKNNKKPYAVAKELGLSNSNVAQWKKGSTPRKEVVQRIAEYFNVSVAYLLTGEAQKEKPPGEGELTKDQKEIMDKLKKLDEKSLEKISKLIDVMLEG